MDYKQNEYMPVWKPGLNTINKYYCIRTWEKLLYEEATGNSQF